MSNISPYQPGQDLISFDDLKLDLIRKTVAKDLLAPEFELFMAVARARGLDPVLGQIHAVKRFDGESKKMVLQVAIDGGRLIAARTGEYAGSDAPVFSRDEDDALVASVTIYRMVQGQRVPFTGIAYWNEFYPGDKLGFMWKKMPRTMLAKCAEMQALRKGFPNDLSGLYAPEEIARDITASEPAAAAPAALAPANEDWGKKVNELLKKLKGIGVGEQQVCEKYELDEAIYLNEAQVAELNQIGFKIKNGAKAHDFFNVARV